jgi:hypothetical protein
MEDAYVKEIFLIVFMEDYLLKERTDVFMLFGAWPKLKARRSIDVLIIQKEELGIRLLLKKIVVGTANHYKRSMFEVMVNIKIGFEAQIPGTKQKISKILTMIQSFQVINENQDAFLHHRSRFEKKQDWYKN